MTKPDIFAPSASGMKEKGNIKSWHKTAWRRKLYKQMNEVSLKANIISSFKFAAKAADAERICRKE